MFNRKYCLLAALASALPIAALHATMELPIVRVTFGDLNLDTPAGVSALYKRVQHGAARYCEPFSAGSQLSVEFGRCVKDAVATTVKNIDNTNLSALQDLKAHSAANAPKSGVENVESAF
jgi:UrcA family protein